MVPLSLLSAPLVRRLGLRTVTCAGLAVVVAGMVLIGRLDASSDYLALAAAVCVLGAGIGVTAPAATSAILDNVAPAQYGVASAVNDATREIGAALGIALVGSVLSAVVHRVVQPEEGRADVGDCKTSGVTPDHGSAPDDRHDVRRGER